MATYAIGDIQGCVEPLKRLLDKLHFSSSDRLWLVGDLVNRGPDSLATLQFLHQLKQQLTVVLGNHDLHLLAVASGAVALNASDTLADILAAADRDLLLAWLSKQPLLHYDTVRDCVLVHAGIHPQWSIPEAVDYADEASRWLQANLTHLQLLYSEESVQSTDLLHTAQCHPFIITVLTRMRYLTEHYQLDLVNKQPLHKQPTGLIPWFKAKNSFDNTRIIFGHWSALKGSSEQECYINIDTGCVWGGELTAIDVDTLQRISVANIRKNKRGFV